MAAPFDTKFSHANFRGILKFVVSCRTLALIEVALGAEQGLRVAAFIRRIAPANDGWSQSSFVIPAICCDLL